jgi:tetratricopeptide (TPR) repeat protein
VGEGEKESVRSEGSDEPQEPPPPFPGDSWVTLEVDQPFGQSWIWRFQDAFYRQRGIEAWREDGVPSYATSNPALAEAYVEMVWTWGEERRRFTEEPLVVLELGAGTGRLAYQFLRRWQHRQEDTGVSGPPLRYVLSDFAAQNRAFWRGHPSLRELFDSGWLDSAHFDVLGDSAFRLEGSGEVVSPEQPAFRPVVIANYLLDTVPQDLFDFNAGRLFEGLLTVACDAEPATLEASEVIDHLRLHCGRRELQAPPYPEDWLNALIEEYRRDLRGTFLLFPAPMLRCLDRLRYTSRGGLLLLAADKGDHRLEDLDGAGPPVPSSHASFSFNVNFHACARDCERRGGVALFPDPPPPVAVTVAALLYPEAGDASLDPEPLRRAYDRAVRDLGPDDRLRLLRLGSRHLEEAATGELLALQRLSRDDPDYLRLLLPELVKRAPQIGSEVLPPLCALLERAWRNDLPLGGEEPDLAFGIGVLLQELGELERAIRWFEASLALRPDEARTLHHLALCHQGSGKGEG